MLVSGYPIQETIRDNLIWWNLCGDLHLDSDEAMEWVACWFKVMDDEEFIEIFSEDDTPHDSEGREDA